MSWFEQFVLSVVELKMADSTAATIAVPFILGGTHFAIWKQVSESYGLVAAVASKHKKQVRLTAVDRLHVATVFVAIIAAFLLLVVAARPFVTDFPLTAFVTTRSMVDFLITSIGTTMLLSTFCVGALVAAAATRFSRNDVRDALMVIDSVVYLHSGKPIKGGLPDLLVLERPEMFPVRTPTGIVTQVETRRVGAIFLQVCPIEVGFLADHQFTHSATDVWLTFPDLERLPEIKYFVSDDFLVLKLLKTNSNTCYIIIRPQHVRFLGKVDDV